MIKIIISNMSCGHCNLKIKAELESNGYEVIKIDMNQSSVLLNTSRSELRNITTILDKIHYVLDSNVPVISIEERRIWSAKLEDEESFNEFLDYLSQKSITVTGFDEEEFAIVLFCTDLEYTQILDYIEELY